jgi:hypothetical protein
VLTSAFFAFWFSIFTLRFSAFLLCGKQQVQDTSSDAQLPQLDATNYKKLTGYYEWVPTGKSRTLYYTDAYGFRETIDINQVINLVQEYNLATGNNYFSGDIIMMMPIDFTDLFAYAIQRGYDPRTFKPIDTNDMEAIHLYIAARKLGEEISRLKARTRESLALDLVPYLGTGKSIAELYQGKNLLTGEELDGWDYAFGAAGTVLPLLKAGRRLFKIFKGADNIEEAVDAGKIVKEIHVLVIDDLKVIEGKVLGKVPLADFVAIRKASIHNPNAETIMLGKYTPTIENGVPNWSKPGPDSYIAKAETSSTYFDLGSDWDKIKTTYGLSNDDMFDLFNKPFLEDGISQRKVLKFSHNPVGDTGYLGKELQYLESRGYIFDAATMTARPIN